MTFYEFMFGGAQYAMAVFPFLAAATALSAVPGIIQLFRRKPRAPRLPTAGEISGFSPELQAEALKFLTEDISRGTERNVERFRGGLASGGILRSGAALTGETELRKEGIRATARANLDFRIRGKEATASAERFLIGLREGRFQTEAGEFRSDTIAGGQSLGDILANFPELLKLFNAPNTTPGSGGFGLRNTSPGFSEFGSKFRTK